MLTRRAAMFSTAAAVLMLATPALAGELNLPRQKIDLVAPPFVGEGGWPSDEIADMAGIGACLPEDLVIRLYHGVDDGIVPIAHLDLYARAIPRAEVRRLPGRDHQLNGDLAEIAADIPGAIARKCRSREHGGRQRHNNGELPHNLPLSSASRTGTT